MTEAAESREAAPERAGWWHARLDAFREASVAHGVLLGLFALFTTLVLAISDELTQDAIAARAAEDLSASLTQVIPPGINDTDLTANPLTLDDPVEGPVTVYRARHGQEITAIAFEMLGQGYGGAIRVLIGLDRDGAILGTRILAHSETPGLGDKVEAAKSDWILGFDGRSLGDPAPEGWKVRRDGGAFDEFSGATITPRAVVGAIRRGLELFERNRAALLAAGASHGTEAG